MAAHINVAGTNRAIKNAYINVGGANHQAVVAYVNVGGTNRLVPISALASTSPGSTGTTDPSSTTVSFNSDGTITKTDNNGGESTWLGPTITGVGSYYWIRFTLSSGPTPTGTYNTWLQLSTARSLVLHPSAGGNQTSIVTYQISTDAAGSLVVGGGTITMFTYIGSEA